MGCAYSTPHEAQQANVAERRRRLSVGDVDETAGDKGLDTTSSEADARGFLKSFKNKSLLDMIAERDGDGDGNTRSGRKLSLGSDTDQDLNKRSSFASKTVTQEGEDIEDEQRYIGYACKKGLKPESPNQDSWAVLVVENDFSLYGVFDGHGAKGHDVSNFVRNNFPKLLVNSEHFRSDPEKALAQTYKKMQALIEVQTKTGTINAMMSGTTCSVILHLHNENTIYVSHVGDSRCVLARNGQSGVAVPLTVDHKPDDQLEKKRIEASGGRVVFDGFSNYRVYARGGAYPGLNMSRALGDLMGYHNAGISAEPSTSVHKLLQDDIMLLLASDGVWEFISDDEAVKVTLPMITQENPDPQKSADTIAKLAWDRWMNEEGGLVVDDITMLVVALYRK